MNQSITIASKHHAPIIAEFQLRMAMETENFKLDGELVGRAVEYFIGLNENSPSHLGFYLVKTVGSEVVGSLLITFQSKVRWWIQSVYVAEPHRCQGHFSSLFAHSVELARQQGVESVKLYAQSSNERAKSTYFRLGMHIIPGKIYSYDFVYGQATLSSTQPSFTFSQREEELLQVVKWAEGRRNALDGGLGSVGSQGGIIGIYKEGQIVGVAKYFQEFSDWRFGIIRYVGQLLLEDGVDLGQLVPGLISELVTSSTLKVAAVRFIASEEIALTLKGGHLQHYDLLSIDLK